MTSDTRLAEVVASLEAVGISCLVMGGHAVRFYGLTRNTNDADLHISPEQWDSLEELLARSTVFAGRNVEGGPSWRPDAFRRFRIGTLEDGRDEWLEFWKQNHLLAPYAELRTRAEKGVYGGRELAFLGLADLIRSKETERDGDWQDIAVLEQFLDARLLAQVNGKCIRAADALASLRSQAGFLGYLEMGHLAAENATAALAQATNPVTQAFLIPLAPDAGIATPVMTIEQLVVGRLRTVAPAAPLHLGLVEVVRRRYISFRKDIDRRNKQEAIRASRLRT